LHSSLTDDPQFIARFEREARLAATLRHPGIVQVYDFDTQGDHLFMVMEYINGGTLKQRLETVNSAGKFLPLKEVSRLFSQIASALDYAHSQKMLHRDLKPSNILLDRSGTAYLTDFGISRIIGSSEITRTGSILGTPAYMSPEQCEGKPLSFSSDLYSLGIILFEMLTNNVPFEADSPLAVLQKQIHDPPPPMEKYRSDLPSGINELLQRALCKDPGGRFASAAGMEKNLESLLNIPALQQPSSEPEEQTSIEPDVNTRRTENDGRSVNKSNGWQLAIGLGSLILIIVGILIWTARQSSVGVIKRCSTPAACQSAALQLVDANRLVLAEEAYAKAASLVAGGDQTTWAKIKCDQGDLFTRLNKIPEARNAFRDCIAWTHNEVQLTNIRQYAQQKIKELK
jgi:serine/threonine protein kinase